jgi:hypothetical protein
MDHSRLTMLESVFRLRPATEIIRGESSVSQEIFDDLGWVSDIATAPFDAADLACTNTHIRLFPAKGGSAVTLSG